MDREDVEDRGATGRFVPTPTAGDMDRGGTFGGGPGSAPGERRCEAREGFIPVPQINVLTLVVRLVLMPNPIRSCADLNRRLTYFGGWREMTRLPPTAGRISFLLRFGGLEVSPRQRY